MTWLQAWSNDNDRAVRQFVRETATAVMPVDFCLSEGVSMRPNALHGKTSRL